MVSPERAFAGPKTFSGHHLTLTELLSQHRALWEERPFVRDALTWPSRFPEVAEWLTSLSDESLSAAERGAFPRGSRPAPFVEWESAVAACAHVERPAARPDSHHQRLPWHTSARKAEQVTAFAEMVSQNLPPDASVIEWCAGKGYLARHLSAGNHRATTCMEQDAAICTRGQELDEREDLRSTWVTTDVKTVQDLDPSSCVVALHACGSLHRHLVRVAARSRCRQIAFSPCCYQKGLVAPPVSQDFTRAPVLGNLPPPRATALYSPLSEEVCCRDLQLDEHALRLATADRVFLKRRVVRARQREQLYRLGLDLWLRRALDLTERCSVPGIPQRQFRESFDSFVHSMAERFGWRCSNASLAGIEEQARQELRRIRALEVVRRLFRRSLELWVVLDAALYLTERSYHVSVTEFVAREVTPRNLLVLAMQPTG